MDRNLICIICGIVLLIILTIDAIKPFKFMENISDWFKACIIILAVALIISVL